MKKSFMFLLAVFSDASVAHSDAEIQLEKGAGLIL